jgi:hypothetical protein
MILNHSFEPTNQKIVSFFFNVLEALEPSSYAHLSTLLAFFSHQMIIFHAKYNVHASSF